MPPNQPAARHRLAVQRSKGSRPHVEDDLGALDEHGNLAIAGRLKDLIIRGGHNIYPTRIEDLAVKHPGIAKAAAFPVPDERLGERVCLAILPADGATPSGDEVLNHLHAVGLSKYDMPEYFLAMDDFPLTASGKVARAALPAPESSRPDSTTASAATAAASSRAAWPASSTAATRSPSVTGTATNSTTATARSCRGAGWCSPGSTRTPIWSKSSM